ncbi:MAG: hypothetical protein U1B30_09530 [Pseudomonadota bacterium]|nr:hypothetical protein [Pseudomonadota bacterium]
MSVLEKILLLNLLLPALAATLTVRLWVPVLARACGIQQSALRAPLYALPVALLAFSIWRLLLVNPLPSDEELIGNFQRHRADLETLIKAYYSAPEPLPGQSRVQWDDSLEVQAIKQRAGVERVHQTMGYWPPEPYSVEWAKKKMQLIKANTRETDTAIRTMEALQVDMLDSRYSQRPLRYPADYHIWKSLLYIPALAQTHDSKLWPPVSARPRTFGRYEDDAARMLPNLTNYPQNWKKGECVYRQLDTHWFIRMCRAA